MGQNGGCGRPERRRMRHRRTVLAGLQREHVQAKVVSARHTSPVRVSAWWAWWCAMRSARYNASRATPKNGPIPRCAATAGRGSTGPASRHAALLGCPRPLKTGASSQREIGREADAPDHGRCRRRQVERLARRAAPTPAHRTAPRRVDALGDVFVDARVDAVVTVGLVEPAARSARTQRSPSSPQAPVELHAFERELRRSMSRPPSRPVT